MILTGRGGEGKSRIGLVVKKLMGDSVHMESIHRLETNRFASANLEHKLVMVDDDLQMTALPDTRNVKSIVTAEDKTCIERKGKQATQGRLYVRLLCFGNGNLIAVNDSSDGFWRRQILISVKDRDPNRVDDPFLIDKMAAELPGIFLWMLEGLKRLLANQYRFTLSERTRKNLGSRDGRWEQPGSVHGLGPSIFVLPKMQLPGLPTCSMPTPSGAWKIWRRPSLRSGSASFFSRVPASITLPSQSTSGASTGAIRAYVSARIAPAHKKEQEVKISRPTRPAHLENAVFSL